VGDLRDVADVLVDQGFVRPDGKTLIPQPHVIFDDKYMWTLDKVKGIEFQYLLAKASVRIRSSTTNLRLPE